MTTRCTIEGMAEWLRGHDDFVILGHVNPDGDAVGSTLGLCHALTALGKRAAVCLPGGVPKLYGFLPGAAAVSRAGLSAGVWCAARAGRAGLFRGGP